MTSQLQKNHVTPEAYLLSENDRADDGERREYVNGVVYSVPRSGRTHNRLIVKLVNNIFNHLKGSKCEVFQSDLRVAIESSNDTRFYYPDVQVSCENESNNYFNRKPCLIIEVLDTRACCRLVNSHWH